MSFVEVVIERASCVRIEAGSVTGALCCNISRLCVTASTFLCRMVPALCCEILCTFC